MAISSPEIKFVRSLQQKKFRKESGLFVVEGVKPVTELLNSTIEVTDIYATELLSFLPRDCNTVSEKELGRISGLRTPNKVLALARIPENSKNKWTDKIILFLDGISNPGNLGTIIRTAKWFGVSQIVCSNDCVDAYDRKVVQSTMGALFHINLSYEDEGTFFSKAIKNNYSVLGTAMQGTPIYELDVAPKSILVIGSESHGMRPNASALCDRFCTIPNLEYDRKIESLNAGVATAIVLSEMTRKLSL